MKAAPFKVVKIATEMLKRRMKMMVGKGSHSLKEGGCGCGDK